MNERYRYNRASRCLSVSGLAALCTVIVVGTEWETFWRFFGHNVWINGLILVVFAGGLALVFLNLLRLSREERLANVVYRRTFLERREGWDPIHLGDRLPRSAMKSRVAQVREMGVRGGPALHEALSAIGASEETARAASIRYLVGILVFLGLLGTFLGLLITIEGVRGVLESLEFDPYADMQVFLRQLRTDLSVPLAGMATAFSTSLFGLGASVVLGFLGLQVTRAQEYVQAKLGDLTLIYLFPAYHVTGRGGIPPVAQAAGAPLPEGDFRAFEVGARQLEAGARALSEEVVELTEVVTRSAGFQRELHGTLQDLSGLLRQGTNAIVHLESDGRAGREELLRLLGEQVRQSGAVSETPALLRSIEEKAGGILAGIEETSRASEERDRLTRAAYERESRTLGNGIGSGLSDLAGLTDEAAREVCRRVTGGLEKVEAAVIELDRTLKSVSAAPPSRREEGVGREVGGRDDGSAGGS